VAQTAAGCDSCSLAAGLAPAGRMPTKIQCHKNDASFFKNIYKLKEIFVMKLIFENILQAI
jgi:hypothetical protein